MTLDGLPSALKGRERGQRDRERYRQRERERGQRDTERETGRERERETGRE